MKRVIAVVACLVIICNIFVGCDSGECQHEHIEEYVCTECGEAVECTLEILARDYADEMMEQAKINAGDLTGNFQIVVLGKEETVQNLQNYKISPSIDTEDITGGLFVKLDVTMGGAEVLFTVYYNFALQFASEQENDLVFTYDGSDEAWALEVIEGNKTILFEMQLVR